MLLTHQICYFKNNDIFEQTYDIPEYTSELMETEYVIFTEDLKEIKVALDEYGHYKPVAVAKDGTVYHINL